MSALAALSNIFLTEDNANRFKTNATNLTITLINVKLAIMDTTSMLIKSVKKQTISASPPMAKGTA